MLSYSLSPSPFPNSQTLGGAVITAGTKIYGYYDPFVNAQAPYSFWDNGVKVGNNESQAPIEIGNGNGWTPASGNHKLEVKDKSGNILETINFTVGSIAPPPPPPPPSDIQNPKTVTYKLTDGTPVIRVTYDEQKVIV